LESWQRKWVAQFRQPHNLFARFRQVGGEELPEMTDRLLAEGCMWVDPRVRAAGHLRPGALPAAHVRAPGDHA
jgi:hypothetical protein